MCCKRECPLSLFTENVLAQPCIVLRRQCQVSAPHAFLNGGPDPDVTHGPHING